MIKKAVDVAKTSGALAKDADEVASRTKIVVDAARKSGLGADDLKPFTEVLEKVGQTAAKNTPDEIAQAYRAGKNSFHGKGPRNCQAQPLPKRSSKKHHMGAQCFYESQSCLKAFPPLSRIE